MWRKGFVQLLLCRAVTLALLPLDKTLRELLCSKVIGKAVGEFKLISRFYFVPKAIGNSRLVLDLP